MSRTLRVECPVTGQKFTVSSDLYAEPAYADEEDETTRAGWGEVVLAMTVDNPVYFPVLEQREALMQRISEGGTGIPVEVAQTAVDRDLPLPSRYKRVTWTVRDLSPDATRTVFDALVAAGLMLDWPSVE